MNIQALRYTRNRVVPHLLAMPDRSDLGERDIQCGSTNKACFDLDYVMVPNEIVDDAAMWGGTYFDDVGHPKEEALARISEQFDCGFRGCFCGWYALLACHDGLLTEHELSTHGLTQRNFSTTRIANYFGIERTTAWALFNSFGNGYEAFVLTRLLDINPHDSMACRKISNTLSVMGFTHHACLKQRVKLLDLLIEGGADQESGPWFAYPYPEL